MSISFNDIITYGGAKFKVVKFATSQDINNLQNQLSNLSTIPLGTILPYSANSVTPPAGFSFCDGTAISRSLYSDLFSLIGTKYGAGDGETTFNLPDLTDAAWLNGSYDKTSYETAGNYTFTATKPGWYKITIKGAGGGGGGSRIGDTTVSGSGGGEGGTEITYLQLEASNTVSVVVGAGGTAGSGLTLGGDGGNSAITFSGTTYTGYGGSGGIIDNGGGASGGHGGNGTVCGDAGGAGSNGYHANSYGGSGGGTGGGNPSTADSRNGVKGGGGAGGIGIYGSTAYPGGKGGDGYCWIEYIGTSQNFIIKTLDGASSNSALINLSQYMNALNNKADKADGVPIGTMIPFTSNGNLPAGYLLCDGSAVSRSMYEDLFNVIGTTYGDGDGVETFNLPDLGFVDGEEADVYGDGKSLCIEVGVPLDANATIIGYNGNDGSLGYYRTTSSTGGGVGISTKNSSINPNGSHIYTDLTSAVSNKVRYIIKAFNGMNTHGALLDLTGMANELNKKYDARTDFTIIYPNGGTAENPANVTVDSRYVEVNPFSGYIVNTKVEVYFNDKWGDSGWFSYNANGSFNYAIGVRSSQLDNDSIIIQTGTHPNFLTAYGNITGSSFGHVYSGTSLPCRVKVWKIGKIN